jgi:hypothetical protein
MAIEPKLPNGYYVYTISVADVVLYWERERAETILPHERVRTASIVITGYRT